MILVDYKLKMGQGYDLIPQNARTGLDCDNRKEEVETPVNTRVFFFFFFEGQAEKEENETTIKRSKVKLEKKI